jgi:tetratricopeptide (TPR) repeat protein
MSRVTRWPRWFVLLTLLFTFISLFAVQVDGQGPSIPKRSAHRSSLRHIEKHDWHIDGRVSTLSGEAISGANVRLEVGEGIGPVKEVTTDTLGRFAADFDLDAGQYETLPVELLVTKSDYQDAHSIVNFPAGKTREIEVTLLGKGDDPDQLSKEELIERLGQRLKTVRDELPDSARRSYDQGVEQALAEHVTAKSVVLLEELAGKQPECVDCAALASLALLESGDWSGATRNAAASAEANRRSSHPRPEPPLIVGVMDLWKHEPKKAASLFMEALKYQPDDPMALEELGRSQLLANDDKAAEEILAKALRAGAPSDTYLLRVRALLGMNDIATADAEMKKYMDGREPKDLPFSARILYVELHQRLELAGYGHVNSLLDKPLAQIEKTVPELAGLRPAGRRNELATVLRKAGASVRDFFNNFPDTVSTENVQQELFRNNAKIAVESKQTYQYLLITEPQQSDLGLEEYRTDTLGKRTGLNGLNRGLMLTSGFASASLIFHPLYQAGSDFRLLGTQEMGGRETAVVAFAQNPERARMSEAFHGGRDSALILVQGIAWIDASDGQILRLRTDLLKPDAKVRLARQTTQIEYSPVRFKQVSKEYWLPQKVQVTVDWKGREYRNTHTYSEFKLFNVKSEEHLKAPSPDGH